MSDDSSKPAAPTPEEEEPGFFSPADLAGYDLNAARFELDAAALAIFIKREMLIQLQMQRDIIRRAPGVATALQGIQGFGTQAEPILAALERHADYEQQKTNREAGTSVGPSPGTPRRRPPHRAPKTPRQ